MSRLADYFFVCGYDHRRGGGGVSAVNPKESQSRVVQRFPERDWPDIPFIHGIDLFCQPSGWTLSSERQEPRFFILILTDVEGTRLYCPCLTFSEAIPKSELGLQSADEEMEEGPEQSLLTIRGSSLPRYAIQGLSMTTEENVMFAPKCLALVSKHDLPEIFRNCLGLIYTVYVERMVGAGGEPIRLETLVGRLLGEITVPEPGASPVKFSLGANDRQIVHAPAHPALPATGSRVALLFHQLGIRNVLTLFAAVLTEQKILFHSRSFARLTDSCTALTALIYPLRYCHTLVPVLPSSLLEVLSSPTPFIIGVNSAHQEHIADFPVLDVITVDLDGGCITVPQNMTIHQVMEPLRSNIFFELSSVLQPELDLADSAFTGSTKSIKPSERLDKELRAVMLRLMAQLLQGYRSCLTLVRIHPEPFITFHKAAFLGLRNLGPDCHFMARFLECMFFGEFVMSRGPPWRRCDVFDELYAVMGEQLAAEAVDPRKVLIHIEALAKELYENENALVNFSSPGGGGGGQGWSQRIPLPTEGHMMRVHQPAFPLLDAALVQQVINESVAAAAATRGVHSSLTAHDTSSSSNSVNSNAANKVNPHSSQLKLVPMGQREGGGLGGSGPDSHLTNRRLEVLRSCITNIFENKISDAKKSFPAVIRTLKSKGARLALCQELAGHVSGNQAMLEHQQFDLVFRLINAALQDDSDMDMHGVAAAILPLATTFCRKLGPGVIQFVYTLIQDHAVWQNTQFWEAAFFSDVQKGIKDLYLALQETNPGDRSRDVVSAQLSVEKHVGPRAREIRKSALLQPDQPSVLEIAASEMKRFADLEEEARRERSTKEEQTVYSQAIHYTTRMVCLLIPMDYRPERANNNNNNRTLTDHTSDLVSNSISNSVAESDSIDAESGFDDTEPNDNGLSVNKFVLRFVDKVCGESKVSDGHLKALHQMVPGVVAMQLEEMEKVWREVKRLPPIQKPKFHSPSLLPGEELVGSGLRIYLLPDGREEHCGGSTGGPALLPAEGAIFLTNYRIVFKGNPIDPFVNELTVVRSFPVTSLTREKRFTLHEYVSEIDQVLREGIQLRSNTCQLIRAAFDDEVTAEEIETFRKRIHKEQFPPTFWHYFAFRGHVALAPEQLTKDKDKNAKYSTIRGFAKTTLKSVSKATGLKAKSSGKKGPKYMLPGNNMLPMHGRLSIAENLHAREEDEGSELSAQDHNNIQLPLPGGYRQQHSGPLDAKELERLAEGRYYRDWERLGLGRLDTLQAYKSSGLTAQPTESTRISLVNHRFGLTKSFPPLLVVPGRISDDSLRRFARFHRQNRFPVVTWRHVTSRALLLRGAAYHARGVMDIIRRHQDPQNQHHAHEVPTSVEAEEYLRAVISATPAAMLNSRWNNMAASTSSIVETGSITPTLARRNMGGNPFSRAMEGFGTLTRSTGSGAVRGSYRSSVDGDGEVGNGTGYLPRAALYIFVDKAQMKGIKVDSHPKADFIPVDYPEPRRIKAAFKKLQRACHPSAVPQGSNAEEQTFLRLVEGSEWLPLMQAVIQLAGAVTDLIDIQGSSVMLCLEDGWDLTCQVSSLAQLCLDPYYRTIQGFRVLIEKEWLAFGHRFNHRSCLNTASQDSSGFTPIFLQFLDIVHQLHIQFPMAFEFSQFYLKFLAYHHVSCRFRTFLLDSELERTELGFNSATEDRHASMPRSSRSTDLPSSDEDDRGSASSGPSPSSATTLTSHLGTSVFDYIERVGAKSPIFFNTVYCPELQQAVLRPFSHLSDLVVWDYFTGEELRHGPPYDPEYADLDLATDEEVKSLGADISGYRPIKSTLTQGYDSLSKTHLDVTSKLLRDIEQLESELGHLPYRWQHHWERLEPPPAQPPPPPPHVAAVSAPPVKVTTPSLYAREYGRHMHKRSTIELLLRGKAGSAVGTPGVDGGGHPHRFEKFNYSSPTPTYCDVCNSLLWGIVRTGYRCQDCGLNCHEKCGELAVSACTKYKAVHHGEGGPGGGGELAPGSGAGGGASAGEVGTFYPYNSRAQRQPEATNIICQGYLYKRGALLKAWKQRWFVLDSIKHELRYYDTREDLHCKGSIDLSEVRGVVEGSSLPGAPKKADEKCFFDLQTSKRAYSLCADTRSQALEWQEKIQSCL